MFKKSHGNNGEHQNFMRTGSGAYIDSDPTAQHHITSHHITSHHITSHHITSHHITSLPFPSATIQAV
jgi:hypothetical protein